MPGIFPDLEETASAGYELQRRAEEDRGMQDQARQPTAGRLPGLAAGHVHHGDRPRNTLIPVEKLLGS
jgi:hypothetical protein